LRETPGGPVHFPPPKNSAFSKSDEPNGIFETPEIDNCLPKLQGAFPLSERERLNLSLERFMIRRKEKNKKTKAAAAG